MVVAGNEDEIILDCYRLARWYHQAPDHFLAMPLTVVRRHLEWTIKLAKLQSTEAD